MNVASSMRPIPGWPGYFADEQGAIWSTRARNRAKPLEQLAQFRLRGNYLGVNLSVRGRRVQRHVHRLVALAFIGEPTGPHT